MISIDVKDKKILYQLNIDSRQSYRSIGRKVGLSKDIVASRIKKLQEKRIINNFYTIVDFSKLGYTYLRFYFNYQYVNPDKKKEIIDYFINNQYSLFVVSVEGGYDLVVFMGVKDFSEFYFFWEKTLDKYRDNFSDIKFSIYLQENLYRYSFLIDKKINDTSDRSKIKIGGERKRVKIEDLDLQILKLLASDARITTVDIAKKINSTAKVVQYRIKNMLKNQVILGFRTSIDFSKLGYRWCKVDIVLKDRKKRKEIINYIKENPNLRERDATLGYVDLELNFHIKDVNEIHNIIEDVSIKFPNAIRNYKYMSVKEVHKWRYIPKM
jgi:DNA-binding Lrp family transcriptional regulator